MDLWVCSLLLNNFDVNVSKIISYGIQRIWFWNSKLELEHWVHELKYRLFFIQRFI